MLAISIPIIYVMVLTMFLIHLVWQDDLYSRRTRQIVVTAMVMWQLALAVTWVVKLIEISNTHG